MALQVLHCGQSSSSPSIPRTQTGNGYTLIAADTSAARSILRMKGDDDKIRKISDTLLFTYSGEAGDTLQFAEYLEANLKLDTIRCVCLQTRSSIATCLLTHFVALLVDRNHTALLPDSAASFVRKTLAESIRSRHPYAVNLLLGGYDPTDQTPHLYWLDYLGTRANVPYAAHGYASYFALSTMDRFHRPDASLEDGLKLIRRCVNELETRLVLNLCVASCGGFQAPADRPTYSRGKFNVKVVGKNNSYAVCCLTLLTPLSPTDKDGVRDVSELFDQVVVSPDDHS